MFEIAGGILIAVAILTVIGFAVLIVSHWLGTSDDRRRMKEWEAKMRPSA